MTYVFLLTSLLLGRIVVSTLTHFSFLIPVPAKKKKDFLLFPYAHKDNSGTISRFQIYLPLLEKDNYTYDIDYLYQEKYFNELFFKNNTRTKQYLFYHTIFWRRLTKVISSRNYKAVFFHRSLFPEYYDQTFPYLERLLRKLNRNITIDFFDAEYARNKKLIDASVSYCDKVCVVNEHLYNYFSKIHPRVYYNNLAINTTPYVTKTNYKNRSPENIFWTGSIFNSQNLKRILPVLEELNNEIPLKLTMVCKTNGGFTNSFIEQKPWDEKTFYTLLADVDIAIYPAFEDTEFARGKVAFKVLDYVAAKIPVVASPLGLSQNFENEKDVLVANNEAEWKENIRRLIADENLRKTLAENAYKKLLEFHSVEATYKNFLKILLS